MPTYPTKRCCLSILLTAISTLNALAQTPSPAGNTPFNIPLSDSTTAQARILPTTDGAAYLVYATKQAQLGLWLLTPTDHQPLPPPEPTPTPTPTKLQIAIVEDPAATTQKQRWVISSNLWRDYARQKHTIKGIIPTNLIDKETGRPPADLSPFLDRAKNQILPYLILYDHDGNPVWTGTMPEDPATILSIIKQHEG